MTLLLDVSASVTGSTLEARTALRQVEADLLPADRLRLLIFNMSVRRLVDFSQPSSNIDEALASVRGAGSSAVFDSLAVALSTFDAPDAGGWSCSSATGRTAAASATSRRCSRSRGAARPPWPSSSALRIERPASLLRTSSSYPRRVSARYPIGLRSKPAGSWRRSKAGENLTSKFRRMLQEFRSSYVLYFTPRGVERTGAHTLEVRVKRPGVDVRARRGTSGGKPAAAVPQPESFG